MIRSDRLLVCEFSHLTATSACGIMLTLGKIGQNPILSQYGRLLYHTVDFLSIYFFQFLPGIFPGIFYCNSIRAHRDAPVHTSPQGRLKNRPQQDGRHTIPPLQNTPPAEIGRGVQAYCCTTLDRIKQPPSGFACIVITIFTPLFQYSPVAVFRCIFLISQQTFVSPPFSVTTSVTFQPTIP